MECTGTGLSSREYLHHFHQTAILQRIPLNGSLELTSRCNLRCVHCYQGPRTAGDPDVIGMDTPELMSLLDKISEAGCLNLLITGGEPLLRRDFAEIYLHAKRRGFIVNVFTNGTLVDDSVIRLFKEYPPYEVEVSLYGATAETYENITGVRGSYGKCMSGIHRLLDNGIRTKLKTILMTLNRHEFFDIRKIAEDLGVKFRFDAALFPCLNGERGPLDFRVPPEEAVNREFADERRLKSWQDYLGSYKGIPAMDHIYECGAGVTGFHVDSEGYLRPCLMSDMQYDLKQGSFTDGWLNVMCRVREIKAGEDFECGHCEDRLICGYCPPFFRLEGGSEDKRSDYLCKMGKIRSSIIYNKSCVGGLDGNKCHK